MSSIPPFLSTMTAHHRPLAAQQPQPSANAPNTAPATAFSVSEAALLTALDGLFFACTVRYGHAAIDDFMLRTVMEATLPMAPLAAKDRCRHQLNVAYAGVMGQQQFKKELYGLFNQDATTDAAEFLGRVHAETRRLAAAAARGQGQSATLNLTAAEKEAVAKGFSVGPVEGGQGGAAANTGGVLLGAEGRVVQQEAALLSMEEEIRRLRIKCGEAVETTTPAVLAMKANGASTVVPADGTQPLPPAEPVPTSPPSNDATPVPPPSDSAPSAADAAANIAVMTLEERCERTTQALALANERLHAYGGFYGRQGGAVHNARIIAAATRANPSAASHHGPSPSPAEAKELLGIRGPFSGFGSPLSAQGGAPMSPNEVLQMVLSASPSRQQLSQQRGEHLSPFAAMRGGSLGPAADPSMYRSDNTMLRGLGGGNTTVLAQQYQNINMASPSPARGGLSSPSHPSHYHQAASPSRYGASTSYGSTYHNPTSTPAAVHDYSAVSVALPVSNLVPSSDTLLSAGVPMDADDARNLLLTAPMARATTVSGHIRSPHQAETAAAMAARSANGTGVMPTGAIYNTPQRYRAAGDRTNATTATSMPFAAGGESRLGGMYHILALEKQETNRWRSYGAPTQ